MEKIYRHRRLLLSIAYNIMGEVHEAEDIVQDVFEQWLSRKPNVKFPKAYLSRAVVTRAIDRLEALKKNREAYAGHWLPVPLVANESDREEELLADPLPYALLCTLEKLNPVERAAYILRRAFDFEYTEICEMLDITEDSARQLIHRAQEKLRHPRIRNEVSDTEHERLLHAFIQACLTHDARSLKDLLHKEAVMYADGGGKVKTAVIPLLGDHNIVKYLLNVIGDLRVRFDIKITAVNGTPGALLIEKTTGRIDTILNMEIEAGNIVALFLIRNPDKLPH